MPPIDISDHHGSGTEDEDQTALRFAAARPAALCTIIGIDGSFSRRLGAQLAVAPDGTLAGSLSDGCLERELANQARLTDQAGAAPVLLRYGQGSPFIDFRLPCGAGIDVLIDPAPDRAALQAAVAALDAREPARLALPVTRPELLQRRDYMPALRLLVLGAGPEAEWLLRLARSYGIGCQAMGPDNGLSLGRVPQGLTSDRWTGVVLLFHDHEWEAALLDWALASDAYYIGSLGGARAREQRSAHLFQAGFGKAEIARVRSPIGLIPHTRDARTLALSILSDIVAEYEKLRIGVPAATQP